MRAYMTGYGYELLAAKLEKIEAQRKEALHRAGKAAAEDSNAWHDNFDYEQGMRDHDLYASMLGNVLSLLQGAVPVAAPVDDESIRLGHLVRYFDSGRNEEREVILGGHGECLVFANVVACTSPLGKALIGAEEDELRTVELPGRSVVVNILSVRAARREDYQVKDVELVE